MKIKQQMNAVLFFTLMTSVTAFAGADSIGVTEANGRVYTFTADPSVSSNIIWKRCEDFSVLNDNKNCTPIVSQSMPQSFYEAAFWNWLRRSAAKKPDPMTLADYQAFRGFLRSNPDSDPAEYFQSLANKKSEIMKQISYYRVQFPDKEKEDAAKASFKNVANQISSFAAAKQCLAEVLAEIQASEWTIEPSKTPHLGREFLKHLATEFDAGLFVSLKNEQKGTVTSFAKKLNAISRSKISELKMVSNEDSEICLLDPKRKQKLQCFDSSGNNFTSGATGSIATVVSNVQDVFTGVEQVSFFVQTSDGKYHILGSNQSNAESSYAGKAVLNFIEKKSLNLISATLRNSGPAGIASDGEFFSALTSTDKNTLKNPSHRFSNPAQISSLSINRKALRSSNLRYYIYTGFAGCWIENARVHCMVNAYGGDSHYAPLPQSGEGPEILQLSNVNQVVLADDSTGYLQGVCSTNGYEIACATSSSSFKFDADAANGIFTAGYSGQSGFLVCAMGSGGLHCYKGQSDHTEIDFTGVTGKAVEVATSTKYGFCAVVDESIVCYDVYEAIQYGQGPLPISKTMMIKP